MTADSLYDLPGPLDLTPSQVGRTGRFRIVNRGPGPAVALTVNLTTDRGATDAEITRPGDSLSFDLEGVRFIHIEANGYPASILLESTELAIDLDAAPIIGNTAADPVFVTGLGMATFAGTDDQSGAAPGAANTGAALMFARTAKAGDPRTWAVVPRGALTFGEAELIIVEYPAAGVPARIDAVGEITNQPSTAGSATGPIPDVSTVGATLDIVAFYDDPDYHATMPAGFTEDLYLPKPGVARLSGAVGHKAGAGGTGLAFAGAGVETQWKTARATFSGTTGPKVQAASGFTAPGGTILSAMFAAAPTPGNLIVGWAIVGEASAYVAADLLPLAP